MADMATRRNAQGNAQEQSPGSGRELCLLSLDGGGVRGLSTLLILKQLMESINSKSPPKPCDYFDMIGGTSTGGLIALMLGRMQLTVDECIVAYKELLPGIFTKIHHRIKLQNGETQGRFDSKALEEGVRKLLVTYSRNEDSLLKDPPEISSCKTIRFVCATSQQAGRPVVFSSYYNTRRGSDMLDVAKIWEAARATSAATTFFDPITINDETFVDGATGVNNPVSYLWTEAGDVWAGGNGLSEADVQCLVSIGTGIPSLTPFGPGLIQVGKALQAIATDTEETADNFRKQHTKLFEAGKAFRFNVIQGLDEVGLEEASKWKEIKAATRLYIQAQETFVQIRKCAFNLQQREWLKQLLRPIQLFAKASIVSLNNPDDQLSSIDLQWFTHTQAYEKWVSRKAASTMLWYKASLNPVDESRNNVAALVSCNLATRYNSFASGFLGTKRELSRVLYYQCSADGAPLNINTADAEAPPIDPAQIMWSLICQGLLLDCTNIALLERRILQLNAHEREVLRAGIGQGHDTSMDELLHLFVRTLQFTDLPAAIAIDNIHIIDHSKARFLFSSLRRLFDWEHGSATVSLQMLVSGNVSPSTLGEVPFINDDTERNECLRSLYFPEWNARRDQVADAEDGTNVWIWSHPQYEMWERAASGILLIEGKPGSGKSVLAKSLQKRLAPLLLKRPTGLSTDSGPQSLDHASEPSSTLFVRSTIPSNPLVVDWFYSTRGGIKGMSHISLLRSVLFQLLDQNRSLFQLIAPYYRLRSAVPSSFDSESDRSSWCNSTEFKTTLGSEILGKISASGTAVICIVDAMDEAEDTASLYRRDRARSILPMLGNLISNAEESRIKFIVLSRPEPFIELDFRAVQRMVWSTYRIVLELENRADIELLIKKGLESLRNALHAYDSDGESYPLDTDGRNFKSTKYKGLRAARTNLSSSEGTALQNIRSYLCEHANGAILWVTLIIGDLEYHAANGMSSFSELEFRLNTLPHKLDALYMRILEDLRKRLDQEELVKARYTLVLICGSAVLGSPLTIREIWEALATPSDLEAALLSEVDPITNNRAIINSWTGFRRQLRRKCGPLIEVVKAEGTDDNTDIGPDDIVQFSHRTVKDFLHGHKGTEPFHFSEKSAAQQVQDVAQQYLKISFPAEQTLYGPVISAAEGSDWQANIREFVDYLERRILLDFALRVLSDGSLPMLWSSGSCLDNLVFPPLRDWSESGIRKVFAEDARFYPWSAGQFYSVNTARAVLLGYSFHYACSRGYVVATRNLLLLFLKLDGHDSQKRRYTIANGALLASIERKLMEEVRLLTQHNRHQGDFVVPKRRDMEKSLDPFLAFATQTGSGAITEYLFELTSRFYARQTDVYEFSVTTEDLRLDDTYDRRTPGSLLSSKTKLLRARCLEAVETQKEQQDPEDIDLEEVREAIHLVIDQCLNPGLASFMNRREEPFSNDSSDKSSYESMSENPTDRVSKSDSMTGSAEEDTSHGRPTRPGRKHQGVLLNRDTDEPDDHNSFSISGLFKRAAAQLVLKLFQKQE